MGECIVTTNEYERHIALASRCGRFTGTCESVLKYLRGDDTLISKQTLIWALERALRYDGTDESLKDEVVS